MKIYVVMRTWEYESFAVMAAFKDEQKANECVENLFSDKSIDGYFYTEKVLLH